MDSEERAKRDYVSNKLYEIRHFLENDDIFYSELVAYLASLDTERTRRSMPDGLPPKDNWPNTIDWL